MKIKQLFILAGLLIAAFIIACSGEQKETVPADVLVQTKAEDSISAERGGYLVNAMGCDDCHSPKRMGPKGPEIISELRFSGYPSDRPLMPVDAANMKNGWALISGDLTTTIGPWGQSFAANITSDGTGIGNWTEENFIRAIREGKYKGLESSRPLLPPMPWYAYSNLTDNDLKSIFAFLKTTKPVENIVPQPIPPDQLK